MSLSDQAYEQIRKEIITCVLAPGQQIAQSQFVERFNLGVTPVREALTRLAHEGLVMPIPRFGYVITPLRLTDIADMYEYRLVLETAAIRRVCEQASDEQIAEIAAAANFTYDFSQPEHHTDFLQRNAEFHTQLARLSGIRRLADSLRQLLDELTRIFYIGLYLRDSTEEMRSEHVALANALLARDADLAVETMRSQIIRSQQRVVEALQKGILTTDAGLENNSNSIPTITIRGDHRP